MKQTAAISPKDLFNVTETPYPLCETLSQALKGVNDMGYGNDCLPDPILSIIIYIVTCTIRVITDAFKPR